VETVDLVPMTQAQYKAWLAGAIAEYADENVTSGRWSAQEAMGRSREEHERLLPLGLATPNNHLWSITRASDREQVGILWMAVVDKPTPHAFIYNIEIHGPFRRHGFAEQAMTKLEGEARRLGLDRIGLHVFGHNSAARPLYEKLGYLPTSINMVKHL
jgi:ribosomal protein S18 acetylase RimI-like enzyme